MSQFKLKQRVLVKTSRGPEFYSTIERVGADDEGRIWCGGYILDKTGFLNCSGGDISFTVQLHAEGSPEAIAYDTKIAFDKAKDELKTIYYDLVILSRDDAKAFAKIQALLHASKQFEHGYKVQQELQKDNRQ